MRYTEKLAARICAVRSHLCVGLDPRPDLIKEPLKEFLLRAVSECAPHAACFKPNIAYFEALGSRGIALLEEVLNAIPRDIPVLLDAKRSDIGETQKYYARAVFETWNCDAVTLNPFLGYDSVEPFLGYEGKGLYLLAVTSNPGAADIEKQLLHGGRRVFELVGDMARRAAGSPADVGFVVGLTNADPDILPALPDAPLLIPGLGAQGGDINALRGSGRAAPALINVSRGVLFPPAGESVAAAAARWQQIIETALQPN
ncbi:MAG TPA: orotidine-5'-phosphate decarboxylase [Verrucomicrobiales bacterium]|nr:orotidine-5'-phosphate decarboxylase [Verrucomicrobiales bacterium]